LLVVHLSKENIDLTLLLGVVRYISDKADLELRYLLPCGKDDAESDGDQDRQYQGYG
jgi:hypothetical protein